jgi:hypothetical protein
MANELLPKVLEAHGGLDQWTGFATVQATIVTGGAVIRDEGHASGPNASPHDGGHKARMGFPHPVWR